MNNLILNESEIIKSNPVNTIKIRGFSIQLSKNGEKKVMSHIEKYAGRSWFDRFDILSAIRNINNSVSKYEFPSEFAFNTNLMTGKHPYLSLDQNDFIKSIYYSEDEKVIKASLDEKKRILKLNKRILKLKQKLEKGYLKYTLPKVLMISVIIPFSIIYYFSNTIKDTLNPFLFISSLLFVASLGGFSIRYCVLSEKLENLQKLGLKDCGMGEIDMNNLGKN